MANRLLELDWLKEHTALYQRDPVAAHDWDATPVGGSGLVPTLLLTTTGRTTGEPRPTPLLYQPCGEGFVVVASKGGSHRHPEWFKNLAHDPACTVQAGKFTYRATARVLSGDERARYWEWMVRFWPDYATYQSRTDREIPVVVLSAASP